MNTILSDTKTELPLLTSEYSCTESVQFFVAIYCILDNLFALYVLNSPLPLRFLNYFFLFFLLSFLFPVSSYTSQYAFFPSLLNTLLQSSIYFLSFRWRFFLILYFFYSLAFQFPFILLFSCLNFLLISDIIFAFLFSSFPWYSFSPYPVSVLYLPLFLFMNLILNPLMHALSIYLSDRSSSIHLSICPSIRLSSLWQSILVSLTTSMYLFIHIPLTSRDRAWEK